MYCCLKAKQQTFACLKLIFHANPAPRGVHTSNDLLIAEIYLKFT